MSMLQAQPPSVTKEAPPSEISSTTDALAQLRLKRREEASSSSDSKATKGRTLYELEAEAAPFEEIPEEKILEKRGTAGMTFVYPLVFRFSF